MEVEHGFAGTGNNPSKTTSITNQEIVRAERNKGMLNNFSNCIITISVLFYIFEIHMHVRVCS